ncbi:MAG: hypothetical protein VX210_03420 [Myxococcota bacterium]|nr:hypothetical protein [Myxococcota bacterium]
MKKGSDDLAALFCVCEGVLDWMLQASSECTSLELGVFRDTEVGASSSTQRFAWQIRIIEIIP